MQTVPTLDDNYIERTIMSNTEDISPKLSLDLIKRLEDKLAFLDHCSKDFYYASSLISSIYSTKAILRLIHIVEGEAYPLIDCAFDLKYLPTDLLNNLSKLRTEITMFAARSKPYVAESEAYIRKMLYLYRSNIPFDVNQYTDHIQRILDIKEEEPDREQLAEEAKKLVDRFNMLYTQYTDHHYQQEPPKTVDLKEPTVEKTSPNSYLELALLWSVIGFFILMIIMVV